MIQGRREKEVTERLQACCFEFKNTFYRLLIYGDWVPSHVSWNGNRLFQKDVDSSQARHEN